jgi:asparagine synthase (glutamine-hydrolysing)
MCGFAGEISFDGRADAAAAERMAAVTAPRGPDGSGSWSHGPVAFSHRRLKIIDTSERGAQPMVLEDLGLAIVFNGCIYNHHELRAELEAEGYAFDSVSDTEVILKAYHRWGEGFLDRLLGMFAFALHETRTGRTLLVRDRLGIKPLYLADGPRRLRFASSSQALVAGGGVDTSVDPVALHHYMSWHAVVPAPRTILAGVTKLPPATIAVIEADGRRTDRRWWQAEFTPDPTLAGMAEEDWNRALLEFLQTAVRRRMVADVPVGVLLSGGLDSSLIAALLARDGQAGLATFSIGFPDAGGREGNEFAFSDLVARELGTDHHRMEIGVDRVLPALSEAVTAMAEPMVSHDNVAFYLLSQEVSKHVKVVQSGQGADEILAGYHWYQGLEEEEDGYEVYRERFFDRPHEEMNRILAPAYRLAHDPSDAMASGHFARPGPEHGADRALRLDTEVMLVDDPVKRVDSMTMAHGLEARVPFLDHEFVELAAACPASLKLAQGGKGVLNDAARGIVPDEVIDREKGSFPVPAISHLEGPVLELIAETLNAPEARERGLFMRDHVERLLREPNEHMTPLDGNELWQLGVLEMWLQRNVDDAG